MHEGNHDKIITLMEDYRTILVNLKILVKQYGCLGTNSWLVELEVTAEGCAV